MRDLEPSKERHIRVKLNGDKRGYWMTKREMQVADYAVTHTRKQYDMRIRALERAFKAKGL